VAMKPYKTLKTVPVHSKVNLHLTLCVFIPL